MGVAVDPVHLSPTMVSRKLHVFAFIERYFGMYGVGPSLSEIANAVGTNRTRAHDLIRRLEREGRIHRTPGKARGVLPIEAHEEAIRVLRLRGWRVDEEFTTALPPVTVTNEGLPWPPVLDHVPDHERDDHSGEGADSAAKKRSRKGH